ncbi:MAG: hypothetical protein AAFU53_02720 [Cyanobacteria bacterium J06632_3]
MNGSDPKPPQFSPQPPHRRPSKGPNRGQKGGKPKAAVKRPRQSRPLNFGSTPWPLVAVLFVLYAVMGLLMSIPQPPFWVWIAAIVAIPLLTLGLNRPVNLSGKRDFGSLMAYLGGLILAVALAVAANYIGREQNLDDIRFFTAIFALAALTFGVVFLIAIAAIVSTKAGDRFMATTNYARSITTLMGVCFLGLCLGGVVGFSLNTIS